MRGAGFEVRGRGFHTLSLQLSHKFGIQIFKGKFILFSNAFIIELTVLELLGIPKVTSFSRMHISLAVFASASRIESLLNVG